MVVTKCSLMTHEPDQQRPVSFVSSQAMQPLSHEKWIVFLRFSTSFPSTPIT